MQFKQPYHQKEEEEEAAVIHPMLTPH